MKISEFKEAIDNLSLYYGKDFKVTDDNCEFYIESDTETLAVINKSEKCIIITNYWGFLELEEGLRQALFDIICKFASTSIPEREDEKRCIIPLPHLVTSDGEQQYLTHSGGFFASERNENLRQTWKEEHLKYIPEEYRKYAVEFDEDKEY